MKQIFSKFLMFTLSLALVLVISPIKVLAASQDDVPGQFKSTGYNNPFYLDQGDITIKDAETDEVVVGTLEPVESYYIEFEAQDFDGFDDVELTIKLFYSYDGSATASMFNTNDTAGSNLYGDYASTQRHAFVVTWDLEEDVDAITFEKPFDSDTTWNYLAQYTKLDESTVSSGSTASDGGVTRLFKIYFTVSKVAPYTPTLESARWFVGIETKDFLFNPTPAAVYTFSTAYQMAWYGEIDLLDVDPRVVWTDIHPGGSFEIQDIVDIENPAGVKINYLSNGNYNERVKSSPTWVSVDGNGDPVTLPNSVTGANLSINPDELQPQEFAMAVGHDTIEFDVAVEDVLGSVDLGSGTDEAGREIDFYFWVKLASNFQNGTYQGTLTVGISNSIN